MDIDNSVNDLKLSGAFTIIASIPTLSPVISQIANSLKDDALDQKVLKQILHEHSKERIEDIKVECLDLLILYINLVLNDHIITENEYRNVEYLKLLFKIREGDLFKLRYEESKEIIYKQLERIYRDDNKISDEEALYQVNLQGLFDLSYDQFIDFKDREVRIALEKGADINDLDTVRYPLKIRYNEEAGGLNLNQEIKDVVWERDGGVCAICKKSFNIRFYPIIPFEKGGSSTYRNVRLLCEECNNNQLGI